MPAGDLRGRHVAVDAVWGSAARTLREHLLEAPGSAARFRVLERWLLARTRRPLRRAGVLVAALRAFEEPGLESVAEVNRQTGLSPKRLIELFRNEVGLTPKTFWRVRRFQKAIRGLESGTTGGAALAADLGYFDQAHLDREFRDLAGASPREYLAAQVERPNHVPLRG